MLEVTCEFCDSPFHRSQGEYNRNLKLNQRICCSRECAVEVRRKVSSVPCTACGTATRNKKFCSRSCAASYNNKKFPKKKLQNRCAECDSLIPKRNKRCSECFEKRISRIPTEKRISRIPRRALSELRTETGSRNSYTTLIRFHARKVAQELELLDSCTVCGYSLHVQCCHIRSVSSFPETSKLSEVNDPTNLIGLCPNHHWELDHGHLNTKLS